MSWREYAKHEIALAIGAAAQRPRRVDRASWGIGRWNDRERDSTYILGTIISQTFAAKAKKLNVAIQATDAAAWAPQGLVDRLDVATVD
jgi:hypothetical protein